MAGLARSTSSQLGRQPSRDAPLSLGTGAAPLQLGRSRSQSVRSPLLMSPIPALRKDQDADASLNNNEKQRMLENASSMDQLSTPFAGAAAQRKLAPRRAPAMLRSLAGASAVAVLLVGCIVATDAGPKIAPLLSPRILRSELPAQRPPAWDYCDWRCARAAPLERQANGAFVATVEHKPLAGVTADMLRFWFDGNVDGVMTHPVDGKVYPRYLVWHPRDHVEQRTVKTGRPGDSNGAVWRINEFFLSSKPSGWTAGDDPAEWAGQLYTKVDLTVRRLGPDGLALGFQLPGLGVSPVSLTHEWRDSPEGALVVSKMYIGIPDKDDLPTRKLNKIAQGIFACGGDAEQAAKDWQLHALEEFGNFKFFLPQLYETVNAAPPLAS